MLAGAALSGLLALAIGVVAFRLRSLRGEIFALLTLAVPFILAAVASINRTIDGGQGTTIPLPSVPGWIDGSCSCCSCSDAAVAIGALAIACAVQHGRLGWGLSAIRDAEDVAEGIGVGTLAYKMWAILLSGLIGGLSGAPLRAADRLRHRGGRLRADDPAAGDRDERARRPDALARTGGRRAAHRDRCRTGWRPPATPTGTRSCSARCWPCSSSSPRTACTGGCGPGRGRCSGALVVPIVAGYDIPYGDLQNWVLAGMLLAALVAVGAGALAARPG